MTLVVSHFNHPIVEAHLHSDDLATQFRTGHAFPGDTTDTTPPTFHDHVSAARSYNRKRNLSECPQHDVYMHPDQSLTQILGSWKGTKPAFSKRQAPRRNAGTLLPKHDHQDVLEGDEGEEEG